MLIGIKNNKIILSINKFIDGRGFAPAYAAVVLAVHCLGLDVFGFVFSVLIFAYVNVFCDDVRPVFAMAFLAPMCASEKHAPGYDHGDGYYTSAGVVAAIAVCVVLIVASATFRFVAYKGYKNLFKKASLSTGLIAFSATLLTAGLFSKYWSADSLFAAGMVIGSSLVFYVYAATSLAPREDNLRYIGRLCAVTTVEILAQLLIFYIGNFDFSIGMLDDAWKGKIIIGWGISNPIGEMLVMLLAGVFYLAYTEERGSMYYVLAMVSLIGTYFTLSRCALLVGVIVFFVGAFALSAGSRQKPYNRILTLLFLATLAFAVASVAKTNYIENFFKFFKDSKLNDRGRFPLWKEFMDMWKSYPVFGTGFAAYMKIYGRPSVFHNFAHNTVVQLLSSAGVVGLAGYGFHRYQTVRLFVTRPNVKRAFFALGVLAYLAMGLLDPVLMYPNFMVIYTIMLVCVEKDKSNVGVGAHAAITADCIEGKGQQQSPAANNAKKAAENE